jgi:hypothetical protein
MKIRSGFVSNSSSSSFIVIKNGGSLDIPYNKVDYGVLDVPETFEGKCQFGWERETSNDIGSKINFCYIQAQYFESDDALTEKALHAIGESSNLHMTMLEEVLKETLKVHEINWNIDLTSNNFYIDHQSSAVEGENLEMFESKEALRDFIFCPDSEIHTDNDNN